MIRKNIIESILEYLYIILIVLECNSPYKASVNTDYYIIEIGICISILLLFLEVSCFHILTTNLKHYFLFLLVYICVVFPFFTVSVDFEQAKTFIAKFIIFLPISIFIFILYAQNKEENNMLLKYVKVMEIISFVSLFFWLFGSCFHIISPSGSITIQWGRKFNITSYFISF